MGILETFNQKYGGYHKILIEEKKDAKIVRIYKANLDCPSSMVEFYKSNVKVSVCFSSKEIRDINELLKVLFREYKIQMNISQYIKGEERNLDYTV